MDSPAVYLSWGWILISVPNILVIAAMIVLFIAALLAPFPHSAPVAGQRERDDV